MKKKNFNKSKLMSRKKVTAQERAKVEQKINDLKAEHQRCKINRRGDESKLLCIIHIADEINSLNASIGNPHWEPVQPLIPKREGARRWQSPRQS